MVASTMKNSTGSSLLRMLSPALLLPVAASEFYSRDKAGDKTQARCTGELCDGGVPWAPAAIFFTLLVVGATYYRFKKTKDAQGEGLEVSPQPTVHNATCDQSTSTSKNSDSQEPSSPDSKSMDVTTVRKMLLEYAKSNKEKKDIIANLNGQIQKLESDLKHTTERLDTEICLREELERKLEQSTQ